MKKKYRGIIPPLVTPLLNNLELDIFGLEKLIEHVIEGGVHGIFILGTTGEAQSLSMELRIELIKETTRLLKKRLPLLVGISDTSMIDSVRLAQIAYEYGADALVAAPPYYFATGQPELAEYYESLLLQLELPLFLYNMPVHTKVSFTPEIIKRIACSRKVIGLKDSSGSGSYLQSVLYEMRNNEEFTVLVGPEEMMAESVLMGADGGVNGGANLFPKLYVDLYNAVLREDLVTVRKLQMKVLQISRTIYTHGNYGSSYLKGLKCALSVHGICNGFMASPFNQFDEVRETKIREALLAIDLS